MIAIKIFAWIFFSVLSAQVEVFDNENSKLIIKSTKGCADVCPNLTPTQIPSEVNVFTEINNHKPLTPEEKRRLMRARKLR